MVSYFFYNTLGGEVTDNSLKCQVNTSQPLTNHFVSLVVDEGGSFFVKTNSATYAPIKISYKISFFLNWQAK